MIRETTNELEKLLYQDIKIIVPEEIRQKYKTQPEKIEHYINRTQYHINLVRKYSRLIYEYKYKKMNNKLKRDFLIESVYHDKTKYENIEIIPYIELSWQHHLKNHNIKKENIVLCNEQDISNAIFHHLKNNKHHPEYWDINFIKPNKDYIIQATNMPEVYLDCLVADFLAMSEELSSNPIDFLNNVSLKKWKLSDIQIKHIIHFLGKFYK